MTLFLSATCLQTEETGDDVLDRLFSILGTRGHRRLPKSLSVRTSGENQIMISTEAPEWLLIVYPSEFPDGFGCTELLSQEFDCRAFNFEIFNGETWWYNLFRSGKLLDIFWQQPTYFVGKEVEEKCDDTAWTARRGNPELVADQFFGLPLELIRPYFTQIDDRDLLTLKLSDPAAYDTQLAARREKLNYKVHPDDRYPLSSVWVFTDFASKFGVNYPLDLQTHDNLFFFALRPRGGS